jgi:hypothetical protein
VCDIELTIFRKRYILPDHATTHSTIRSQRDCVCGVGPSVCQYPDTLDDVVRLRSLHFWNCLDDLLWSKVNLRKLCEDQGTHVEQGCQDERPVQRSTEYSPAIIQGGSRLVVRAAFWRFIRLSRHHHRLREVVHPNLDILRRNWHRSILGRPSWMAVCFVQFPAAYRNRQRAALRSDGQLCGWPQESCGSFRIW